MQYLSKLSEEALIKSRESVSVENIAPKKAKSKKKSSLTTAASRRAPKRKAPDSSDDELLMEITQSATDISAQTENDNDDPDDMELSISNSMKPGRTSSIGCDRNIDGPITDYDRLITSTMDVADHYMQVGDETCRFNAVFFVFKAFAHVQTLGNYVYNTLKSTLVKRIRDKKPMIRAQAVLASQIFQDYESTKEAFNYHFEWDPDLSVRKALFRIMDPEIFGYDFLVSTTRDAHESLRREAFRKLGSFPPTVFNSKQIHRILHNGLNERDRQASYAFKTHTLEPWLKTLYDGLDLCKLLESFDLLNHHEDVSRLLTIIYENNLEQIENNGTATKLHHVVETFRDRWLSCENMCLPILSQIDEKVTMIWMTLFNFCKTNQSSIKSVRVRDIRQQPSDPNESLEKIIDSQEQPNNNDDIVELYERLTPDLINLIDFIKRFVQQTSTILKDNNRDIVKCEFIFQQMMKFTLSYEIGDDVECKNVKENLTLLLKENLLTQYFESYIPPIIKSLRNLIYTKSSNLLINYVSDSIINVRSHLEDVVASSQAQYNTPVKHSRISKPDPVTTRSAKKVKISESGPTKRVSYMADAEQQNIEYKMATIRVEIEELKDKLDNYVKEKNYGQAKVTNEQLLELTAELASLQDRRRSVASDLSHMTMVIDTDPAKFSSTMLGDTSMNESMASCVTSKYEHNIFKDHPEELMKCLQMYYSCLQTVQISEVPETMRTHLRHLTVECLEWFKDNGRILSLLVSCHGLTAVMDKTHAKEPATIPLLLGPCHDPASIEVRTSGYRCLVDVMCQHEDLDVPMNMVEKSFNLSLREYGKYDPEKMEKRELLFITAVIEGAAKLYYFKRLGSPKILSHLILWWYHPRTHSKLRQFIGVFLPMFVADHMNKLKQKQQQQLQAPPSPPSCEEQLSEQTYLDEDTWLRDLLKETFLASVESLHNYIQGPGINVMDASDMNSLINFLCNLVPRSFHADIRDRLDDRIDELTNQKQQRSQPLVKYLKQSKSNLSA